MIGEASFGFAVGPEHVYGDECFGEIRDAPNVLDQHSTFATVSVVGGRCCGASLTVPRAVVILPATGVGVLALAAATAGATRLVEGLSRAACTLESLRP